MNFPVPVRALEFGLARRVRPSRPRQPAHLHTQAEYGAYLRDPSRFPRRRPFTFLNGQKTSSPELIGSRHCVPMAFTAESPPAQGLSRSHIDQLMCASLFQHPLVILVFEVGILKVSEAITLLE